MSFITLGAARAIDHGSTPVVLPTTQADADATTFVAEAASQANANRQGAGLGLDAADAVLICRDNIPAAVSGFNDLSSGGYYDADPSLLQAALGGTSWAILWEVKNWDDDYRQFALLYDSSGEEINIKSRFGRLPCTVCDGTTDVQISCTRPYLGWSGWVALWYDSGVLCFGLKEGIGAPPTRVEDCCSFAYRSIMINFPNALFSNQQNIFGSSSGSPFLEAGRVILSTRPLGVPGNLTS